VCKNISRFKNYLGFFLLGIAITLKPITGVFYITFLIFLINEKISLEKKINKIFISGLITFLIPLIYFSLIYINFNFFLTPPYYSKALFIKSFYISHTLNSFLLYSGFLLIVCSPIFIDDFIKIMKLKNIFIIITSVTILFISNQFYSEPEISFGIFSGFFNTKIINGLFAVSSVLFYFFYLKKITKNFFFYLTIVLYLILLSFILPAQRYLLLIVPIVYLFFLNQKNLIKSFLISCTLFIPLNFILLINQHMTGNAAVSIVEYLKLNNLLDITCPQAIDSHVGNYFKNKTNCSILQFQVLANNNNNLKIIYQYNASFLFIKKKFYIVNLNKS
jgi:hypothetical protein